MKITKALYMYITLKYYTTTLLTQPEGSNSIQSFGNHSKWAKAKEPIDPTSYAMLCYA